MNELMSRANERSERLGRALNEQSLRAPIEFC